MPLHSDPCRIGIITVSDRASRGVYQDLATPAIEALIREFLAGEPEFFSIVIPDEQPLIEQHIIALCDEKKCHLVLTSGGTGPAPRDVTPDATRAVCPRILEGFGEKMRAISLKYVPTAILSRQVGAIRNESLVINLPGQPKSISEILEELFEVIPFTVELVSGFLMPVNESRITPFRPKATKK